MDPDDFAAHLKASIEHTIIAHSKHPKRPRNAVRFWDRTTPYAVHPIWCAMTLLTETALPPEVRQIGYQALLWHDLVEDTDSLLPEGARDEARELVDEMTFASFSEEVQGIWGRSDTAKLLKLYDKVSNLLDGVWMKPDKWNNYVRHTLRLADFVMSRYGELNIVKIARAVCVMKP